MAETICPTEIYWLSLPDHKETFVCGRDDKMPNQNFTLCDLLYEEIDTYIPEDSLVVFLPEKAYYEDFKTLARYLGQIMSQLTIKKVSNSEIALEEQTSAILSFCRSLLSNVKSNNQIDDINFIYGIADILGSEFAGIRTEEQDKSTLFYRFDILSNEDTNRYLQKTDPTYEADYKINFAHLASTIFSPFRSSSENLSVRNSLVS